jgi:hypothetical protein
MQFTPPKLLAIFQFGYQSLKIYNIYPFKVSKIFNLGIPSSLIVKLDGILTTSSKTTSFCSFGDTQ